MIDDPRPIRLERAGRRCPVDRVPRRAPADGLLPGRAVWVRDEVYGNLYLAERAGGPFTDEDEDSALSLAATAGVAIDNARLYEESASSAGLAGSLGRDHPASARRRR